MLRVIQKFGVLDSHGVKYEIAQVEYSGLPGWVDHLVTHCTDTEIRYALDRYADRLVREFRYTPKQALDRIPQEHRRCAIWDGCVAWRESECLNLKKNVCRLLEMPADTLEVRAALTDLVNLWREGRYVVTASPDSRR